MLRSYFDTSALVKNDHVEGGTPQVQALLGNSDSEFFISRLGAVEMLSGFAGKVRTGNLSSTDYGSLLNLGCLPPRLVLPWIDRRNEEKTGMSPRQDMQVRIHKRGPEADAMLLEESILHWRQLGPTAVWDAIYEMLDLWFLARGMDPEAQRIDRTHVEIHPVVRRSDDAEPTLHG